MDNKKKTKLIVIIGSLVLVMLALLTNTYSLFVTEKIATNPEDYSTGLLSIEAKSKSDVISLSGTLPMTNSDGVNIDPYIFTIKNNGNVDYKFNIKLLSTSENTIDPQYIKLKVDDGSINTLSSLTNSTIKSDIILNAKESIDITLRIWMDENTPNTEIGKSFNSKIVTEGQAIYTESNYDALDGNARQIYEKFNKTTTITNNCNTLEEIDEENQIIKDPLGNLHYYGQDPNNYIYFNCSDYSNPSDVTCETWRVIGVQDGKVKLMRGESIGEYSWDTSASSVNSGYGINEWSQADLMKLLNPGYENNNDFNWNGNSMIVISNSLYYNSQSGKCYNKENYNNTSCNFTNIGIKANTKDLVTDITYHTGGHSNSAVYSCAVLTKERGTNAISNPEDGITRTTSWIGKIAVPYSSDYGYATDFEKCNTELAFYDSADNNYACRANNWMWYIMTGAETAESDGSVSGWLFTSNSSDACDIWLVHKSGMVSRYGGSYKAYAVVPVLYLNSDVNIDMSHAGSSADPYVINVD